MFRILFASLSVLLLSSCSEYSRVLKSTDIDYKFQKAVEYYEAGECYKSLPIFEELIGLTRASQKAEEVYYYYAKSQFCIEDYYMANYFLRQFTKTFSNSPRAEECLFLAAVCSSRLSSESSLDQTDTRAAIDEFQLFIDTYPNSSLRDSCNNTIMRLGAKLERKEYEIARLYWQTMKYKSAVVALTDFCKQYPNSQYREEAMKLIVESGFEYASNSIPSRRKERYREVMNNYLTFAAAFPESKYLREAEVYYIRSQKMVDRIDNFTENDNE
jgi:outer membrane protein assembly factor BamD